MLSAKQFQQQILKWFDQSGRKDLPWQQDISPYRVWVSEIMLQQTQVKTVIPYYERFVAEMPTVQALAAADEDTVLHLWTGLGYYARARNLHQAAKIVVQERDGCFPDTVEQLTELPGIGRSTAGAIRSIAFSKRAPILDGNVKRVLARYEAIGGWPGQTAVASQLWAAAEKFTPRERVADYSQAMMDLGATLCTRSSPDCEICPLSTNCVAYGVGKQSLFPGKKPKKKLPVKTTTMLLVKNAIGDVFLAKRPPSGIWGGLWSFPEVDSAHQAERYCIDTFAASPAGIDTWPVYRHSFSHYHLDIEPALVTLGTNPGAIMEGGGQLWYNMARPEAVGLAAPVAKLLKKLENLR